jgi:hypothetical protein
MNKTRKNRKKTPPLIFTEDEYKHDNGMMTAIWGPSTWLLLHTMSFNYPNKPSADQKKHYRNFIYNLQNVLPCKHCRENLKTNLKTMPLTSKDLKNRETFSRYVYNLHELINKMLKKKSGLSYEEVRERYENFRARCSKGKTKKREKGCTEPLVGEKSKCILKIVPQTHKCKNFQIDKKCLTRRRKV